MGRGKGTMAGLVVVGRQMIRKKRGRGEGRKEAQRGPSADPPKAQRTLSDQKPQTKLRFSPLPA